MVLDATVLRRERLEVKLVPLESCESTLAKDGTPQETFWGYNRGGCVAASAPSAVEVSK
jgi:hypothetical protein